MSEIIENIYTFKSEQGTNSYIYSIRRTDDYLGYDYYLLTKDKNDNYTIIAINPIYFLQNSQLNITPIHKNTPEYELVLKELEREIKNINKKETVRNH